MKRAYLKKFMEIKMLFITNHSWRIPMNTFKSMLSVAVLLSGMSAAAFPGQTTLLNIWAKVPSRKDASEFLGLARVTAENSLNNVYQRTQPYLTKKNAAISAGVAAATAATVVAYKKGYIAKAANAFVSAAKTAKNAVTAKFASKK
jgi:hypothetical protein